MEGRRFLAADLGAESGRVVAGTLEEGRLSLEEIHRFPNRPVQVHGTLHWDVLNLYGNVLEGMRTFAQQYGAEVDGIGIDTWAVDFGLLGRDGSLLQNPVCYRDHRTDDMPDVVRARIPEPEVYRRTGIFLLPIYTLCQMVALRRADGPLLDCAETFLMMPDLVAYFLSGEVGCERTNAISTQLYDPREGTWRRDVFEAFDLPLDIMPPIIEPGTVLGAMLGAVQEETGLGPAEVIAPCTHDTGSAVAAVPGQGDDWAFLSSGTWSILGSLSGEVVTTDEALAAGLCNELTLEGLFLCRNIMGLWLLQQARASWLADGDEYSYTELVEAARRAPAGGPIVDPNDDGFMAPEDMPDAIRAYCRRTGQTEPDGPAAVSRCILESLALCYRHDLDQIGRILGRDYRTLHVVGGGSQNTLLCQFTADATGLGVQAGPVEATVAGNVLVQAYAKGLLDSPGAVRRVVRDSTRLVEYEPEDTGYWRDRYGLYRELLPSNQ